MLTDISNLIQREDSDDLGRLYKMKGRPSAPSVNKILDYVEDKTALYEWKKRVGTEKANEITKKASGDGSKVHAANEAFFTGEVAELDNSRQKQVHNQFGKFLELVTNPLAHEQKIFWSSYLNENGDRCDQTTGKLCSVGGTLDALLEVNTSQFVDRFGKPIFNTDKRCMVVDYKTQSKKKKLEWMLRHYIQLAAYIGALNQLTEKSYNVSEGMIVGATSRSLYLYYLDARAIRWYWANWLRMLSAYYFNTKFDWISFSYYSQGYDYFEDSKWEFMGVEESYMPQEIYIKSTL